MNSVFMMLNSKDLLKGFFVAVISAIINFLYTTIQSGALIFDWKDLLISGLTAGLAYLTKNLFTNSEGKVLTKESL
jgi:uncharacterized membrane-anchored protein